MGDLTYINVACIVVGLATHLLSRLAHHRFCGKNKLFCYAVGSIAALAPPMAIGLGQSYFMNWDSLTSYFGLTLLITVGYLSAGVTTAYLNYIDRVALD